MVDHGDGLHDSDSVLLVFNEASQIINLHIHDLPKNRRNNQVDRRVQIWKFVFLFEENRVEVNILALMKISC